MRLIAISSALAAALLVSGCGRARVITAIKPDGSWTRTIVLTGQEKKEGQMTPALEETFAVPSGPGWKSHEEKKDDERTMTFERTLAPGAKVTGDVTIKAQEKGRLNLVNEATVTRLGPRRFEYRE